MPTDPHIPDPDAPDRPPIALPEGTRLRDQYRVGEVLGAGSFGITYRAHDERLHTTVAIKEYYPRHLAGRTDSALTVQPYSTADTDDFSFGRRRFLREARTIARFNHPNVVRVRSYFEAHGTGYIVMDYYDGDSLADYLAAHGGRLPEDEAVALLRGVLDGLRPVHDDGVLHRDIDPQNIYRTMEGRSVLLDFGAARVAVGERSRSLSVILKPGYAPYEQYHSGGDQGPWTDVYACAATLYRCLTGLTPPEAPERRTEDTLAPPHEVQPDVSLDTSIAVQKGMALDPERRPRSAAAFAALLDEGETTATVETTVEREDPPPEGEGTVRPTSAGEAVDNEEADEEAAVGTSGRGLLTPTAILLLGAAVVGGVAGPVGASTESAFAFFGTWAAVIVGLVQLFREGEKAMAQDSRDAVREWLCRNDWAQSASNWPESFTVLFDAVFTEDHLSWQCAVRSALASVLTLLVVLASMVGFGVTSIGALSLALPQSPYLGLTGTFVVMASFNVVVDYVSLYETRWLLGRMARSTHAEGYLGYLVLDVLLTAALFLSAFMGTLYAVGMGPVGTGGLVGWVQFSLKSVLAGTPLTAMAASTFFTSVWVWLYALSGLSFRALYPLLRSLGWLTRHLDVERRPVHTMGILLAVLASVGFAVSAPFVLS